MARNGSGTYSLVAGNPVVTGTTITSTWANNTLTDIATALTGSIAADGQTPITANLPMATFRHTGVGNAVARTDYAAAGQVQDGSLNWIAGGGTADAITATYSPALTALIDGQLCYVRATAANVTTTPTFSPNGLTARTITKIGGTALVAGDIAGNLYEMILRYNLANTRWELLNPAIATAATNIAGGLAGQHPVQSAAATTTFQYVDNSIQDFRLTLTTALPVTTADVTGATTIYCTPYKGNRISLYSGTYWKTLTSAEFSLALGTLTANLPYDVFCYDNAGTATLEFLAWTSATARATALAYQDGVLVKSGATTRRYLGTFYTTSTTQTEDSVANRYLWNYYNRVDRTMQRYETTASWTYTTATFRQANGSTANQLNFIQGVAEDSIYAELITSASNSGGNTVVIAAINLDATNGTGTTSSHAYAHTPGANQNVCLSTGINLTPQLGVHYLAWIEYSVASGTTTWLGSSSKAGITGRIKA